MIRVEYNPRATRLLVQGHAGSGDPGRDLVCAGVSALLLALREELLALEEEGKLSIRRLQLEPGYADIRAKGDEAELVYDTVVRGLELLERLFGEFVKVHRAD